MSILPPPQTHGHYSPRTSATRRAIRPGCGRLTAIHHVAGYLWCHDRFNLQSGRRELCPGYGWMPDSGEWAWFARKAW